MRGLVIKNTGSWYTVKTDDGQLIESKIKGNFRLKGIRSTNPVAVGDYVQLITNQEGTRSSLPSKTARTISSVNHPTSASRVTSLRLISIRHCLWLP